MGEKKEKAVKKERLKELIEKGFKCLAETIRKKAGSNKKLANASKRKNRKGGR